MSAYTLRGLEVTSQTTQINEYYCEAITTGHAPGTYCKIQILGDERVGKTSLRKNLMGEEFDPEESSTFGIDTRMCSVKHVDESWQEKSDDKAVGGGGEFSDIVRWFCSEKFWKENHSTHQGSETITSVVCVICLLILLLSIVLVPVCFVEMSVANSLSSVSWMACITLIITKQVRYYILLTGVDSAIFIINMIGYLMLVYRLPMLMWGPVFSFLALQVGVTGVFEAIMGQHVTICLQVLSIKNGNHSSARYLQDLSVGELVILTAFYIIGCNLVLLMDTFTGYWSVSKGFAALSKSSKHVLITPLMVILSMLVSVTYHDETLPTMTVVALCCGLGHTTGIALGRVAVTVPHLNSLVKHRWLLLPVQLLYGWLLVRLSGREMPYTMVDYPSVLTSGFIPLFIAEVYRNHLLYYDSSVVTTTRHVMKSKEGNKLSLNLSLWDFAGQELYYNTHHTFMSVHAVYVVVFDLMDFVEVSKRHEQIQRIKFWLNSVRQHANSPILLVGTHGDCVDQQIIDETQLCLNNSLLSSSLVYNKHSCFFPIDNTNCTSTMSTSRYETQIVDIGALRRAIQSEARKVKRLSKDYPIRWRRFREFIAEWRLNNTCRPYIMLPDLFSTVSKFGIHTTKELMTMLAFFHDNGEILYDSVDTILRQFVVIDPQVMIDIMEALVVVPTCFSGASKLTSAWKHFERTGILEYDLLKHIVVSRLSTVSETTIQVLIGMLQAKDLICKVERATEFQANRLSRNGQSGEIVYVVPSMLPSTSTLSLSEKDTAAWTNKFFINFGQMLPDAVFLRLLARCASYSDVVSYGKDQCQLYSEGGFFTLGTNYFFMLRKFQPCDNQYLVEISIKATCDWHPFEVLKYLCSILDTLRCRDFPGLQFYPGLVCPYDEGPHQGCQDATMMHILNLGEEIEKGETVIRRWCNGRLVHVDTDELETPLANDEVTASEPIIVNVQGDSNFVVVGGKRSRIIINRRESDCKTSIDNHDNTVLSEASTTEELGFDVYISCNPHDEGWVQEHMVRYLTGPPHYLTVCLNQYDNSNHPLNARRQNANQIKRSALFVIVCSRYYKADPTGRLQYEREVARKSGATMVCVTVNHYEKSNVEDLFDVEEISLSSGEYMGQALDILLEKANNKKTH